MLISFNTSLLPMSSYLIEPSMPFHERGAIPIAQAQGTTARRQDRCRSVGMTIGVGL
jgi:hypothetical protein